MLLSATVQVLLLVFLRLNLFAKKYTDSRSEDAGHVRCSLVAVCTKEPMARRRSKLTLGIESTRAFKV